MFNVMYMIEITEDKMDNVLDCMKKGINYLNKAMECAEYIKTNKRHSMGNYDDEDDYDEDERYARHGSRSSRGRSRYSNY